MRWVAGSRDFPPNGLVARLQHVLRNCLGIACEFAAQRCIDQLSGRLAAR
jgi:hypothetical protein